MSVAASPCPFRHLPRSERAALLCRPWLSRNGTPAFQICSAMGGGEDAPASDPQGSVIPSSILSPPSSICGEIRGGLMEGSRSGVGAAGNSSMLSSPTISAISRSTGMIGGDGRCGRWNFRKFLIAPYSSGPRFSWTMKRALRNSSMSARGSISSAGKSRILRRVGFQGTIPQSSASFHMPM